MIDASPTFIGGGGAGPAGPAGPPGADGTGIPDGGIDGQVLTKQSATDGDADWETPGAGGSDDQTAAEVPFTPAGGIAATDVQAAIEEVATDAASALSTHAGAGDPHPGYTTAAELTTAISGKADTASAVMDGDAAGGDLSGTYPNPAVVDDSHSHTGATLPVSGELVGAAVARTIAAGVIDVTGLHYVIVTGEGSLDDDLPTLNGGVDGQFVVLESAGQTITFSYAGNCNLVNQEANSIQLGNFVTQVFAIYSATDGAWQVWSNQQPRSIMAEDGGTEIIAGTALIEGFVSAALNWTSVPAGWRAKVGLFLDGINAAPADASLAAGGLALWFDQTNGASALKIKGKSANGTVVTATVPLT